jgi:glutaredoxin
MLNWRACPHCRQAKQLVCANETSEDMGGILPVNFFERGWGNGCCSVPVARKPVYHGQHFVETIGKGEAFLADLQFRFSLLAGIQSKSSKMPLRPGG